MLEINMLAPKFKTTINFGNYREFFTDVLKVNDRFTYLILDLRQGENWYTLRKVNNIVTYKDN
jgi:hypothetical protein